MFVKFELGQLSAMCARYAPNMLCALRALGVLCVLLWFTAPHAYAQIPDDENYCSDVPDGIKTVNSEDTHPRGFYRVQSGAFEIVANICSAEATDNEDPATAGVEIDNADIVMESNASLAVEGSMVGKVSIDDIDTIAIAVRTGGSIIGNFVNSNKAIDGDSDNDGVGLTDIVSIFLQTGSTINGLVDIPDVENVNLTLAANAKIMFGNANTINLLRASDAVINNAGTISSGTSNTLDIEGGRGVNISNSGLIQAGTTLALDLSGSSDTVILSNSGTISAGNNYAVDMRDMQGDTQVTINNSGTIEATNNHALDLSDADGEQSNRISITNSGNIQAGTFAAIDGRGLSNGVTLINSGIISAGDDYAINMAAITDIGGGDDIVVGDITLNNSGTISAGDDFAIDMSGAGNITLVNSGVVSVGGEKAFIGRDATGLFTLSNSGTINAAQDYALDIGGVAHAVIDNQLGATISAGGKYAIDASDISVLSFTNAGTIVSVDDYALYLGSAAANIVIDNSGSIAAGGAQAISAASADRLTINNFSSTSEIVAGSHFAINANQVTNGFNLSNQGNISAGGHHAVDARGVSGGVTIANSGTISAQSGISIDVSEQSGSAVADVIIANSGSILSNAGSTIDAAQVSNFRFTNVGAASLVKAADDRAIDVYSVDNLRLTNEGEISAGGDEAIYLRRASGSLAITNSGSISAIGDYAIDAAWEDTPYSGTLDGGLGIRDVGEFVSNLQIKNSGIIRAGGNGAINIAGSQASTINNATTDALIHSNRQYAIYAADAQGAIEIKNSGTISADDGASIYAPNANASDSALTIINSGILSAGDSKVLAIAGSNNIAISNNGENAAIAAQGVTAIDAANYLGHFLLNNQGSISASNRTIDGRGGTGNFTLTNSGIISSNDSNVTGASFAIRASDISGQFVLSNSGIIAAGYDGAVLAENIAGNIGQGDEFVRILNSGTVQAGHDYGLRLDASNDVSITNLVGGTITAAQDYALSANNVTGDFTLINSGQLASRDKVISLQNADAKIVITNLGTITASGNTAFSASDVSNDVVFSNAAHAQIAANRQTLDFGGLIGDFTLTNSGAIKSLSTDLKLASDDYAINLDDMRGNVLLGNIGTATISAASAYALRANNVDGDIELFNSANSKITATQNVALLSNAIGAVTIGNSGTISASGTGNHDYVALDVRGAGGKLRINNYATGSIDSGAHRAIMAQNLAGGMALDNQGIIRAASNTIDFSNSAGEISIQNSGLISADEGNGATLIGNVLDALILANSGTISGTAALIDFSCPLANCGKVSINNSGTMQVNAPSNSGQGNNTHSVAGYALHVSGTNGVALTNSGTISAHHDVSPNVQAIDARGMRGGFALTNLPGGAITAINNILINADNAAAGNMVFENAGILSTGGETALTARAAPAALRFANIGTESTILAANNVLDFGAASGAISFTNDGTIRNSDSTASTGFIINAQNALGGMAFTNNGTIRSVSAAGAGVTLDGRLASGALSITNGENATMIAANNTLIDARLASNAGLFSLTNAGILTTGGAYAVRASALSGAATISNSGSIQADSSTLDLRDAGGKLTLTNAAGGLIAAATSTALDVSGALAGVALDNHGVIISRNSTINLDNAGGAISLDNAGVIRATGALALRLAGVNNARISNSGTIAATTGTAINITGTNVRLNNSGIIAGTDRAIVLGSAARLTNSGSIIAPSPQDTAIYATGINATITLETGSKIIGKIEAAAGDIASDADRHMIAIKFDPHITYALQFDETQFDVTDSYANLRPIAKGSAHAVGVGLMRASDMLGGRRARALYRAFYRPDSLPINARITSSGWGSNSETEKTATDNYCVEQSAVGVLQRANLLNRADSRLELLLAYETASAEILSSKQLLDSVYSGLGIGTMIGNKERMRLSAYALAGVSRNQTEREVLTNENAQGVEMISGSFAAVHVDAGLGLHQYNQLSKKWALDTRIGIGLSSQSSNSYEEGDLYRFAAHDLQQGFGHVAFRLSRTHFAGPRRSLRRRPLRRSIFLEFGGHARSVLQGSEHDYSFLDSDIVPDRRAVRYIDEIESASGITALLGFDIQLGRGSYLIGQIGSSADDDKIATNMGGLSLLWRF